MATTHLFKPTLLLASLLLAVIMGCSKPTNHPVIENEEAYFEVLFDSNENINPSTPTNPSTVVIWTYNTCEVPFTIRGKGLDKIIAKLEPESNANNFISLITEKRSTIKESSSELEERNYSLRFKANSGSTPRTSVLMVTDAKKHTLSIKLIQVTGTKVTPQPARVLALSYMAHYNVGKTPGTWATNNHTNTSGYFDYNSAKTVAPEGFHTPTAKELSAVFSSREAIFLSSAIPYNVINDLEEVTIGNKSYAVFSSYHSKNGVSYAIKNMPIPQAISSLADKTTLEPLRNYSYLAAYRYTMVKDYYSKQDSSLVHVKAIYLGEKYQNITLEEISNEQFWNNPQGEYEERWLPACGLLTTPNDTIPTDKDIRAAYWSTSTFGVSYARYLYFSRLYSGSNVKSHRSVKMTIRPFVNHE